MGKGQSKPRLDIVEDQSYIMYLQLQGIIGLLVDKGIVTGEEFIERVDKINKSLYEEYVANTEK